MRNINKKKKNSAGGNGNGRSRFPLFTVAELWVIDLLCHMPFFIPFKYLYNKVYIQYALMTAQCTQHTHTHTLPECRNEFLRWCVQFDENCQMDRELMRIRERFMGLLYNLILKWRDAHRHRIIIQMAQSQRWPDGNGRRCAAILIGFCVIFFISVYCASQSQ